MTRQLRSRLNIAIAALALGVMACTCSNITNLIATPTPGEPPTPTSAPTAPVETAIPIPTKPVTGGGGIVAGDLQVVNTNVVQRSDGGWRLLGEVFNNTEATAANVSLAVEWLDASGASLGTDVTYILTTNIAPGETAPFVYNIYDAGVPLASFTADVTDFTPSQEIVRAALDLENPAFTIDESGDFHCTGELVNNTNSPALIDGLAASILDSNRALFSADIFGAVTRYLAPGERTPYRVSPLGVEGASVADYFCYVYTDAVVTEPLPKTAAVFKDTNEDGDNSNDVLYFVDSLGYSHLVGEVVNNGEETLNVGLTGGLYDEAGNVIDAAFNSIPVPLAPGEALPFDFTYFSATNYNATLQENIASFTVQVDLYWTYASTADYAPLETRNGSATEDGSVITETVDVMNTQNFNVDYAYVVASVTDATGQVVGYSYATTDPIAAGATVKTQITIYIDPSLDPSTLQVNLIAKAPKP
ncbi:MAG: hypothetical protein HYZ49_01505 [Chloroflexi bacterium]|nr:hypothetical protein [Chloroflexota bacterium]